MANWIVTEIEITGAKDTLDKIEKAINTCNDNPAPEDGSENNWVGYIFGALGINAKKFASRAFWSYAHFNKHGHLVFEETSSNSRSKCAEALKQHFAQEISGINYKSPDW